MKDLELVSQTMRDIGRHWRFHLAVSLPCSILNILFPVFIAWSIGIGPSTEIEDPNAPAFIVMTIFIWVFGLVSWGTVAILWHRLILLGARWRPQGMELLGLVPEYCFLLLIASFKTVLALTPVIVLFVYVLFASGSNSPILPYSLSLALDLTFKILMAYALLRWSLALPALAVGNPTETARAWKASKPLARPILVAALMFGLFEWLAGPPNATGTHPDGLSVSFLMPNFYQALWYIAYGWAFAMGGIAILTTVYARLPAAEFEPHPAA